MEKSKECKAHKTVMETTDSQDHTAMAFRARCIKCDTLFFPVVKVWVNDDGKLEKAGYWNQDELKEFYI